MRIHRRFHCTGTGRVLIASGAWLLAGSVLAATAPMSILGMWQFRFRESPAAPPPDVLTAVGRNYLELRQQAQAAGHVRDVANMKCLPTGFPQLMLWRSPLEIMQSFGRVSIITEHDPGNDEPRTIYLNKPQSKDPDPSWNGHSVGHWRGQTLVIDTVGLNGRGTFLFPITASTHTVELLSLEHGGKILDDRMTFDDPMVFVKPYTVTVRYDRMPNDAERMEAVCEPDLDAISHVDLNAVKAYDGEAARMLDPQLQYNAAGSVADRKQAASDAEQKAP